MNVLLIGSGGREHALARKITESALLTRLYAAPGNPGIAEVAKLVPLDVGDNDAVLAFCREASIGLVVIGPEAPLVGGLVDVLEAAGIKAFGPSRAAAQLEGSKGFTKDLCARAGIPTAAYARFSDAAAAHAYLDTVGAPIVIKADGLAAGKGVVVAETLAEARAAIDACFDGTFGAAGAEIVIEEKLVGEEASFFALSDGINVVPFATAQDHKRAYDGDTGPNTGGMGAYSPAPIVTDAVAEQVMAEIVRPTIATLAAEGTPFRGVLYAGLMLTADGPKLIEYNVRFGDPECQVILLRLRSDLLATLLAVASGTLAAEAPLEWRPETALTVVMAAKGYPGTPETGTPLGDLDAAQEAAPGVAVFQAGTRLLDGRLVAAGGRVLNVCALGAGVAEARDRAYAAVAEIRWQGGFYRRDIGMRALANTAG
ncbi:phosphoribosylamine--glycine ligase [Segnochrobactrum spirostomi]|uniref:Phosphoribosylamine--glycine ligase n=1 Tax=Segnochrobactrum spirostomi TaxID=2608987 RepID=A0A6A7Y433_9HYPH|nr:phosphoribosylamine--glycine ligase [Segnochrobactrum spirostomi]MQT13890.1 phosphoribosylamine--glycine ligase [Segnochrobactrum spirostomi]